MAPRKDTGSEVNWQSATFDNASSLGDVADPEGVKQVVEKVKKHKEDGDYKEDGYYKFWYHSSQDGKFTKVVVSKEEPDYDMSAKGNAPALGQALFTAGEADSRRGDTWRRLAAQIEEKGKSS